MLDGDLSTGCMQVKVDEFFGVVSCSPWRVWLDSPSQPESQLRAQGILTSPRRCVSSYSLGHSSCRQGIEGQRGQINGAGSGKCCGVLFTQRAIRVGTGLR